MRNWPLVLHAFLLGYLSPSNGAATGRKPQVVGCVIGLNNDLPKKHEPLLLVRGHGGELQLAMPETSGKIGSVNLREGEELVVSCPGNKNMLELTHADPTMTRCYSGNMVKIGGDRFETNKLECANRAAASLLDTKKPCANNMGTAVQIGFKVEKWHPLVEVCHNLKESLSYYAVHKVFGSSLAGKVIQSYRPGFSRGDKAFFHGFNPDEAYNQNNQLEVFSKTFGQKKTEQYFASKKFLARGHLAPDADFLFGSWQLSTYFFVNTAPQWQAINAGHWLAVENSVRKLAINLGADLDVATGTYGVLSLTDSKRKEHEVYLVDGKRLPVPLLMWKVVRNPRDSSCMAIVATNDPFLGSPPKTICRDVCANYGWPELQSDLSKGYIYCCDFKDFKRTVNYAPDFNCKSILRFQ